MTDAPARRRIALFTRSLAGGGAQRVLVNLSGGFLAAGCAVDVVVARGDGPLVAELPAGVRLVDLGARRALFALPALARYFRIARPDAALATINYANVVALLARGLSGARFPLTIREANVVSRDTYDPRSLKTRVLRVLMRLTYRHAHAVIVNSQDTRKGLLDWRITGADSIHHIPNPVDLDAIAQRAGQPTGHAWLPPASAQPSGADISPSPVVVAAGRLVPQKDFATLIDSFALVCRQTPDARLIILGEGPLRNQLERQVAGHGLQDRISLPGFVSNPYSFMRRASLFVLSSRWEGSPNVLIEALACGAAVVTTDCPGGARELIATGGPEAAPGRLTPVGDAAAMAQAIIEMLRLPADPRQSVDAAARHSLDAIIPRYASVMGVRLRD